MSGRRSSHADLGLHIRAAQGIELGVDAGQFPAWPIGGQDPIGPAILAAQTACFAPVPPLCVRVGPEWTDPSRRQAAIALQAAGPID
jgi:hypothetical protein